MSVDQNNTALCDRISGHFHPTPPQKLGVAVSGGSDSLALLHLLHDWSREGGAEIFAVSVDHGLRAEAAQEAAYVGEICKKLGVPHDVLRWQGWNGQGNLSDRARRARYSLIGEWAETHALPCVALGHTADDQAETFLMRLARQAGVDGLSAMSERRRIGRVEFCRPALKITRQALRDDLLRRGVKWVDDPTNDNPDYDRVRVRQMMPALEQLGLTATGLSNVAGHMAELRTMLYWYVFLAARDLVSMRSGDILIERKGFRTLPKDIARRLMQQALRWVNGAEYSPRGQAMDLLLESIRGGTGMTLQGCLITISKTHLRITREAQAVAKVVSTAGEPWDQRWCLDGAWRDGYEIRALGFQGLQDCPDWHETGLPEATLKASPAMWEGDILIAAPLAGQANGWHAKLIRDEDDFFGAILSH